jgi:hypothetical protein
MKTKVTWMLLLSILRLSGIMAQIPLNGLVAYYPFNGNANDVSGYGNDGTVDGAALTTDRFGNVNNAYYFDGLDDRITVPNNDQICFSNTSDFTIAFWMKTTNTNWVSPISKHYAGNWDGYFFSINNEDVGYCTENGHIMFYAAAGGQEDACSDTILNNDEWVFITGEYSSEANTIKLFVNGDQQSDIGSVSGEINNTQNLLIGYGTTSEYGYIYFRGKIDDIRIYKRALSRAEIQALYYEEYNVSIITPDLTALIDSSFEIPVNVENIIPADNAISYQFDLTYDPQKILYQNYSIDGTLSENGIAIVNPVYNILSVAWAGQSPLSGSGTLVNLQFKALETGSTTPLISNFLLNTDTIWNVENGSITIQNGYGDVDGNSIVQAFDAALALQYSVDLDPLPDIDPLPWEEWRTTVANVDGLGNITAYDASLILQYVAGIINSFPAAYPDKSYTAPQANVNISLEEGFLIFRSAGELYGLNISVQENRELLGVPQIMDPGILSDANISGITYKVGLAIPIALGNDEVFMKIPFNNTNAQSVTFDMNVNTEHKLVTIGPGTGIDNAADNSFVIYPNPTAGSFSIDLGRVYSDAVVTITAPDGRIIQKEERKNGQVFDMEMNALPGIYLVTITTDKERAVFKIVMN